MSEGEGPVGSGARPGSLPRRGCMGSRAVQEPRGAGQNPGFGQLCSLPAPLASLTKHLGDVGFTAVLS